MNRSVVFATAVALALGIVVRVLPAIEGPLTPGEGGLIVVMVDDLREWGLLLPHETTYNASGIPFLYPPLSLYIGAGVGELLGTSSLDAVRLLTLLLALATLGVFVLLARRLLPPVATAAAVMAYALMPHAFDGILAGGGLTRGVGLVFAMLAIYLAASRTALVPRQIGVLGVLLGLTALSHPQAAIFAAAGSAIFLYRRGLIDTVVRLLAAGMVAILVVAPWVYVVTAEHGFASVASAGHRWEPVVSLIRMLGLNFSGAAFGDLFVLFGVLGLVLDLSRRRFVLAGLVGCLILAGEPGGTFLAGVPWALLGGVGIQFVVERFGPRRRSTDRPMAVALGAVALFLALISSLGSAANETSRLQRVSSDQAAAMAWVATETDPATRFIVATTVVWGFDEISEWFPAIAQRQSVATVQGSEWLGSEGFVEQRERHRSVLHCTRSTARCMAEWAASAGLGEAWIFIPKGQLNGPLSPPECCPALSETVRQGAFYEVVYDGVGATIARPVDRGD
jgi:hypothetical protein